MLFRSHYQIFCAPRLSTYVNLVLVPHRSLNVRSRTSIPGGRSSLGRSSPPQHIRKLNLSLSILDVSFYSSLSRWVRAVSVYPHLILGVDHPGPQPKRSTSVCDRV